VKAVPMKSPTLHPGGRDRVAGGRLRDGAVKGSIEDERLGRPWEMGAHRVHGGQRSWEVLGVEFCECI